MKWFLSVCLTLFGVAIATSVATSCNSSQFACEDGTCIDKFKWCDAVTDCNDESDENYCRKSWWPVSDPNKCKSHHFKCRNGVCIPQVGLCDGIPSCSDSSDESSCYVTKTVEETTTVASVDTSTHWETAQDVEKVTLPSLNSTIKPPTPVSHALEMKDDENILQTTSSTQATILSTQKVPQRSAPTEAIYSFNHLDVKSFQQQKDKALNWLLSKRDESSGWSEDTPRSLVAIYLSKTGSQVKKMDELMMLKQLHLQLSVALMKNATSPLPICELSLYVNALLATCSNPRNFHGLDLISTLRQRVNVVQQNGQYISPLVYLTLCLSNETTFEDLRKVKEIISSQAHLMDRIDIQALTTLTASCIAKIPKYSSSYLRYEASRKLLQKLAKSGLPDNIYELALLTQALNEVQMNELLWNRQRAMKTILQSQNEDGSFGDILATYFVLPILSGKSLVSLNSHCKTHDAITDMDTLKKPTGEKHYVQYSLYFGSPVEMSQTIMLKVAKESNFLEVMKLAEQANPLFKFEIDYSQNTPAVYTLGGVTNDVERGLFWSLYISKKDIKTNTTKPIIFTGDIRKLIPERGEENIFWFKSLE